MQSKRKFILLLFACVMVFMYVIPVTAAESQKGSIKIILADGEAGTSKENVVFEYAKVADIIDGQYQLLEDYGGVDLNTIEHSAELEEAAKAINGIAKADGRVATDRNGETLIADLEVGVYLLRVADGGEYENVSPVLITLPMWNEERGIMEFDITVTPKHSPIEKVVPREGVPTGDNTRYMTYVVLLAVSIGTIVAKRYCLFS